LNLDAYDLAIILNNALENAIEACTKMKKSKGFIRLYAYTKGKMFFIDVENSFEHLITLDKSTKLPISNKPDKTIHGMGLSNIQRCARKYFGDIDFQVSEMSNFYVFRLTVMLQGRD
jgi:sensor histidine kinase YesM